MKTLVDYFCAFAHSFMFIYFSSSALTGEIKIIIIGNS